MPSDEEAAYLMALAAVMMFWGVYGIFAIHLARKDHVMPMLFFVLVLLLVIVVQTIFFFTSVVWIKDSYSMETEV